MIPSPLPIMRGKVKMSRIIRIIRIINNALLFSSGFLSPEKYCIVGNLSSAWGILRFYGISFWCHDNGISAKHTVLKVALTWLNDCMFLAAPQ
jgi:hypothetical protein